MGTLLTDPTTHPYIAKAIELYCKTHGVLWAKDKEGYPIQRNLPTREKDALIEEVIMNLAYLGGEWLYQYLKERLFCKGF